MWKINKEIMYILFILFLNISLDYINLIWFIYNPRNVFSMFPLSLHDNITGPAAIAKSVRAFAPQVEGWVLEF